MVCRLVPVRRQHLPKSEKKDKMTLKRGNNFGRKWHGTGMWSGAEDVLGRLTECALHTPYCSRVLDGMRTTQSVLFTERSCSRVMVP